MCPHLRMRPTHVPSPHSSRLSGPSLRSGALVQRAERGGHYEFGTLSQTLSIAGLYFAMRFDSDSRSLHWPFFVGLVCGLGYWNALITAYTLIPTLIWLVPISIRRARAALSLILGAVVGAVPRTRGC